MYNPRGRIVNTNRPVVTSGGATITGVKPLIVVYVKDSKRHVKDFDFRCRVNGIAATRIDGIARLAFECTGTPQALEMLTGCQCILEWHFSMNVRPPRQAAGGGAEKKVTPVWKERMLSHPEYARDEI
jgi:hypothetical protein